MKKLRPWILPVLTGLVVTAAILLPQQLSQMQDQALFNSIHAEALTVENDLPIQPPDLVQRIGLLSGWMTEPDIIFVQQELTDTDFLEEWKAVISQQLTSLSESGLIPVDILPQNLSELYCTRLHLQKQLMGADFLVGELYSKNENLHLWLVLDEETGHILWLEVGHPLMRKLSAMLSPAEIGTFFLETLDIDHQLTFGGGTDALFTFTGQDGQYAVAMDSYYLRILPISAPATDAEMAAAIS